MFDFKCSTKYILSLKECLEIDWNYLTSQLKDVEDQLKEVSILVAFKGNMSFQGKYFEISKEELLQRFEGFADHEIALSENWIKKSIGLLSYTFLKQTGCDDIVVPVVLVLGLPNTTSFDRWNCDYGDNPGMHANIRETCCELLALCHLFLLQVDYEFNPATGAFVHLFRIDEKQFSSNLTTLLNWSPFSSEAELLKQFDDVGLQHHGTKIIVFNLWYNDDGIMELDFKTDAEDIMIAGGQKKVQKASIEAELTQRSVANRYQYSLRVYSSILYLKLPQHFKILLRGLVVEPHYIIKDIMDLYCHLVGYKNRRFPSSCTKTVLELPPADSSGALEPLKLKKGIAAVGKSPATQSLVSWNTTSFPPGLAQKRKRDILNSPEHVTVVKQAQSVEALLQENRRLHEKCLEYEETERQLSVKVQKLRNQLRDVEGLNEKLLAELRLIGGFKMEKP
ncbi:hypothetical protein AXF42_Ash006750 [Apostasia shenzhenica]|uniref:Morc S5 domain-containing protein n=1 Tax=Apostasia shenzhenica TaxID=1088818 RepID=A0A2I0AJ27_9ASPA|nr:hypothetical protein AXF42_Ash006750 [Apostasia shenzhenica]